MSMRKYFLALPLTVLLASCGFLAYTEEDTPVITEISQVVDVKAAWAVPLEKIPEKYRESYKDKIVVVSKKNNLKKDAKYVPLSVQEESWDNATVGTAVGGILTGLTGFFPWLAGIEGLLALLIPRKRQHYASAMKNMATLDLKDSIGDLAKGLGLVHSSPVTAEVWEKQRKKKKTARKPKTPKNKPELLVE